MWKHFSRPFTSQAFYFREWIRHVAFSTQAKKGFQWDENEENEVSHVKALQPAIHFSGFLL